MATRKLRPEDWAPVPQTRIQIRAAPLREPREERVSIAKCVQKPRRPTPINYPPGESPPIPNGRESLDNDSPRAPEIVDFATTGTWTRRGLPAHIAYQQQQWGGKRVGSPSSVSQYSSRQSEMSFGILDYYTRDPSPSRSSTLPPTPKLPQSMQGPPKIGTPVIDPAMEKFDFGLPLKPQRPQSQSSVKNTMVKSVKVTADAHAGAEQQRSDAQESESPSLVEAPQTDKPDASVKSTYSLFPKDTTPPSRPSLSIASRQDSALSQEPNTLNLISSVPSHQQPDPSYRPRKESLSSSLRSRKDSFTFYRTNAQRIPLRVFSASSNSNSSVYTTPRTSSALTHSNGTNRVSPTISPPDSANSNTSNAHSQSRWSEDTITSPTVAAFSGRRASFGSLLRDVEDERQSGQYPACFFEDDDDEVVPLARKLWGRSTSRQSEQAKNVVSGEWDGERRRSSGWRGLLLCGCGG